MTQFLSICQVIFFVLFLIYNLVILDEPEFRMKGPISNAD